MRVGAPIAFPFELDLEFELDVGVCAAKAGVVRETPAPATVAPVTEDLLFGGGRCEPVLLCTPGFRPAPDATKAVASP